MRFILILELELLLIKFENDKTSAICNKIDLLH